MRYPLQNLKAASVKDAIDPHDFYLRELGLDSYGHRSGGSWRIAGLCPFHDDTKSGSFKVNLENGAFKCFSCDAAGGDIIAFKQRQTGLSFFEVLKDLGREWGVDA